MKLWHLLPRDDLPDDSNPWSPWYDKCFGHVVRAETEEKARAIAQENSADETKWDFASGKRLPGPWLDPNFSTCAELLADGEPGSIMTDIHSA